MRHETVNQMFQRYHNDKAKGIKHTPLHTLQECCEEAGIDYRLFGRYAAQFPNAPQPVLQHAKNVARSAVKYYRKHEFVQWVNQVRQQKEKAMPDIKTALQAALSKTANEWAADDEAHHKTEPKTEQAMPENAPPKAYFTTTNNVCRNTFECILKNPGKSRKEIVDALNESGFKPNSTTTLIGQMIKQGHIRESNGLLYAINTEYQPLKSAKVWANKQAKEQAKEQAPQRKYVAIVNKATGKIINPRPAPTQDAPQINAAWDAETLLNNLSIKQARALYDELRTIFGG